MVVLSKFSEVTEKNQKHLGTDDGPGGCGAGILCSRDGGAIRLRLQENHTALLE
jgi:hypothetical protein